MSATTLVSVVMPVFNAARHIETAVASVLAQTHQEWELLLVDDGSTDGSWEIGLALAKRHAPRLRVLAHPNRENRGVSATRNLAIREAHGEWLGFLDADDAWMPERLEVQLKAAAAWPQAGMIYGRALCMDEHGTRVDKPAGSYRLSGMIGLGIENSPVDAYERFVEDRTVFAPCCTVLARAALVRRCGAFREGLPSQCEDYLLWTEIAWLAPVVFVPEVLAKYRVHADSWSSKQSVLSVTKIDLDHLCNLIRDVGCIDRVILRKARRIIGAFLRHPSIGQIARRASAARALLALAVAAARGLLRPRLAPSAMERMGVGVCVAKDAHQ